MNQIVNQTNYGLIKAENSTINLDNNDIFMHSAHNEAKSVIAERFIKTLTAKMSNKNDS